MRLFKKDGYPDFAEIFDLPYPFIMVVGGRATGKTYGAISEAWQRGGEFVFMRRRQTQLDAISRKELSPFVPFCRDRGIEFEQSGISRNAVGVWEAGADGERGDLRCIMLALTAIANVRGFDVSGAKYCIYDEFIPEPHETQIRNEGLAFLNAYETMNRNRELDGREPLKMICLSNSGDLANPVFLTLGIADNVRRAFASGREMWTDDARGICVISLTRSPISQRKRDTALYRVAGEGDFSAMALDNEFVMTDVSNIRSRDLKQLKPIVRVGGYTFCGVKGTSEFHVTEHSFGHPVNLGSGETAAASFRARYLKIFWLAFIDERLSFSNLAAKAYFRKIST